MDIEKLIEQLNNLEACAYGYHINGEVLGIDCSDFEQIMVEAAEEISKIPTLQAELEQVKRERDAAQSLLAERIGVRGAEPITTAFGLPLDRLRELAQADREGISPCTFCRFNPPSSSDGKPCCMCPAQAALRREQE